ncbi:MAG: hypothetical protein RL391_1892, partial [Actinomycetota bacterium]
MAEVTLPQLGETVTEGTITRWFKKVGEAVAADEPLFEVSTDKVDTEVPSPVAGVLLEIRVPEGDTVPVGAVIAVVGDGVAAPAPAPAAPAPAPAVSAPAPAVSAPAPAPAPAPAAPTPAPVTPAPAAAASAPVSQDNRLLSPVVRRLVNEHGLDVSRITGTGPGGRITREDVLDFIDKKTPAASPAPVASVASVASVVTTPTTTAAAAPAPVTAAPAPRPAAPTVRIGERDEVVALSKIRKATGSHMVMSKSVSPHAFS